MLIPAAAYGGVVEEFPLLRCVPSDVYLVSAARQNSKQEFLRAHWRRVFKALESCGIGEDLWDLVSAQVPAEASDQLDAAIEKVQALFGQVEWSSLFEREHLMMMRMNGPAYQFCLVTRVDPKRAEQNFAGLSAILREGNKLIGNAGKVSESRQHGATMVSFAIAEAAPFSLTVARRGDVLFMGLGESLLSDAVALHAGAGRSKGLVASERFVHAFDKLGPAEDEMTFFDAAKLSKNLRALMSGIAAQIPKPAPRAAARPSDSDSDDDDDGDEKPARRAPHARSAPGDEEIGPDAVLRIVVRVLDDFSIFDYTASTVRTDGYRTIHDTVSMLTPDASKHACYKWIMTDQSFDNLDRLVPAEAVDFSVESGISLAGLYDWLESYVASEDFPNGKFVLEKWAELQKEKGIHLRDDLLALFEGPSISLTLDLSGRGAADWVWLVKVSNERGAARQVKRGLDAINGLIGGGTQPGLSMQDVTIDGHASFHRVSHPFMMMMQMSGVYWGTAEGYLVFGSGEKAIATCLMTLAGKHPGISKNPRYAKEGVAWRGQLSSASFADKSKVHEEWRAGLAAATMGLGMVSTFAQVPEEQGGKFLKALPPLLGKLAKVTDTLDFFLSDASVSSIDGREWRTISYSNYKDPAQLGRSAEDDEAGDAGHDSASRAQERVAKPAKPHPKADKDSDD